MLSQHRSLTKPEERAATPQRSIGQAGKSGPTCSDQVVGHVRTLRRSTCEVDWVSLQQR